MDFSKVKAIKIPEGYVKKIESNRGGVLWEVPYVNMVPLSIDTDGTIYNGGLGYKNGYRIRSGGAESANGYHDCTGFIPCKARDVIRFCFSTGARIWSDYTTYYSSFNFSDALFANLGQATSQPMNYGICTNGDEVSRVTKVNGVWEYTVMDNANIAYIRFTVPGDTNPGGENLIVTVNEEITI